MSIQENKEMHSRVAIRAHQNKGDNYYKSEKKNRGRKAHIGPETTLFILDSF